jgi:hypothetical protein
MRGASYVVAVEGSVRVVAHHLEEFVEGLDFTGRLGLCESRRNVRVGEYLP